MGRQIGALRTRSEDAHAQLFDRRSINDAISESTTGDIYLLGITFGLMIVFACFTLGKSTFVGSRIVLGMCSLHCIVHFSNACPHVFGAQALRVCWWSSWAWRWDMGSVRVVA
jgi:hypothetical protein